VLYTLEVLIPAPALGQASSATVLRIVPDGVGARALKSDIRLDSLEACAGYRIRVGICLIVRGCWR